jgi:hypothetical protein
MKLSGMIHLGNLSKSCHRLKIPRCLLLGDFGVTRAKMNHKFSPFFSGTARPIGLKFFLGLLRTNQGACSRWDLEEKKNTHPDLSEVVLKKIEPDQPNRFGEKGGKLRFFPSKIGFEKNSKQ